MKFALVGYGNWGRKVARKLYDRNQLVSISSTSLESLQQKLSSDGLLVKAEDLKKALLNDDVDAVFVATNIDNLYQVAKKSLLAGKHVFLEKPGSTTYSQMQDLIHESKANDKKLVVNYIYAIDPAFVAFKTKHNISSKRKNIDIIWKKNSNSPAMLYNLVSHIVYMILELEPNQKCKILQCAISDEKISASLSLGSSQFKILCERNTGEEVFYFTSDEGFSWSPRIIRSEINGSHFRIESDFLDKKITDFVSNKKTNNSNLNNCAKVLKILDRMENFAK